MSNNPVDTGEDYQAKPAEEEEAEEFDTHAATQVSFRIPVDAIMFYKRMAQNFYEGGLIPEPKLSFLAKACLNLLARRYSAVEDATLAQYIQKNLAQARGPNAVSVQQVQREMAARGQPPRKTVQDFIPASLRRKPPIDNNMPEPEWM